MPVFSFRFTVLLCLITFALCGRDSTAVSQYSLAYNKNLVTLTITYFMENKSTVEAPKPAAKKADTSGNVFERFFGKGGSVPANTAKAKSGRSLHDVENSIKSIIAQNPDLELEPDYPGYILEMADLHKSKRKRERALRIYAANNTAQLLHTAQSSSVQYAEGRMSSSNTITITCKLKLKKKTQLQIPEFIFDSNGLLYYSQALSIDLK